MNKYVVGAKIRFKHAPEHIGEIIGVNKDGELVRIKTDSGEYVYHISRLEVIE